MLSSFFRKDLLKDKPDKTNNGLIQQKIDKQEIYHGDQSSDTEAADRQA